jgi:hypothetical protein
MIHTHQTAPTQFFEANGVRFAYRRFGKPGGVPLLFNQALHRQFLIQKDTDRD